MQGAGCLPEWPSGHWSDCREPEIGLKIAVKSSFIIATSRDAVGSLGSWQGTDLHPFLFSSANSFQVSHSCRKGCTHGLVLPYPSQPTQPDLWWL